MERKGDDLVRLTLEMTPHWHPNLRTLFELTDLTILLPD